MNVEVKGVHYDVSETTQDFIDKKMKRLEKMEELIQDLTLTIKKDANEFVVTADIHFRWGVMAHIRTDHHELYPAIETLLDKMETKARREKEKVQDHQK